MLVDGFRLKTCFTLVLAYALKIEGNEMANSRGISMLPRSGGGSRSSLLEGSLRRENFIESKR